MRKIFLDCGGHDGCSIRMFGAREDSYEFEKYSFEPNYNFWKFYDELNTILIPKAVHITDGFCNFYMQTSHVAAGSSVDKRKTNLSKWKQLEVECIDFSKWVVSNFEKTDYIILKLDIEGMEYDVLEKMIENKSIEYINELYVEFHYHLLNIVDIKKRHDLLINKLNEINLIPKDWDALDFRKLR